MAGKETEFMSPAYLARLMTKTGALMDSGDKVTISVSGKPTVPIFEGDKAGDVVGRQKLYSQLGVK